MPDRKEKEQLLSLPGSRDGWFLGGGMDGGACVLLNSSRILSPSSPLCIDHISILIELQSFTKHRRY